MKRYNDIYFCFEHGIRYTSDDLMCPKCEQEICEEHDKQLKENEMIYAVTNTPVKNTYNIQKESLIRFAQALGFQPVEDVQGRLRTFRNDNLDVSGRGRMSVNNMIALHNEGNAAEWAFSFISSFGSFKELIDHPNLQGYTAISIINAHSNKIVQKVKGKCSGKTGFFVQGHKVRFASSYMYTEKDKQYFEEV